MNRTYIIATVLLIVGAGMILFFMRGEQIAPIDSVTKPSSHQEGAFRTRGEERDVRKTTNVSFSGVEDIEIIAEIADNNASRKQGLSSKEQLGLNEGMLFVFDESDQHAFWMPDMNFAIDIIWIDEHQEIVHIEQNVTPDTYPETFEPDENALYVLEINAGLAQTYGLSKGDRVEWNGIE